MSRKARSGGTLHVIIALLVSSAVVRTVAAAGPAMAEITHESAEQVNMNPTQADDPGPLFAALRAREEAVEERETQLEERLNALHVAETQIEEKLASLIAAEESLSATIAQADSAAETDLARLTTVYENMKPKEAAALFTEMSPGFAAGFLGLMRPDSAALIMSELEPDVAYSFSVVLAGRNATVPTD
ncbi:MotE family protein [Loktanella sp. S4079]|uniref:MotE family protein n=1 Tax=Loktanella sp. S4079 TaxID=579483 RepID=UPI0005FA84A5|nr:hypothetical protein [Loktanella sp. S4079]KJZ21158.1 hypothetical protein TW80_00425 [Loktanella sp. S4079]